MKFPPRNQSVVSLFGSVLELGTHRIVKCFFTHGRDLMRVGKPVSVKGKDENQIQTMRCNEGVFVLLGGKIHPASLSCLRLS